MPSVELHKAEYPNTSLAVVHGIQLVGDQNEKADGGGLTIYDPFTLDEAALKVISYTYQNSVARRRTEIQELALLGNLRQVVVISHTNDKARNPQQRASASFETLSSSSSVSGAVSQSSPNNSTPA